MGPKKGLKPHKSVDNFVRPNQSKFKNKRRQTRRRNKLYITDGL